MNDARSKATQSRSAGNGPEKARAHKQAINPAQRLGSLLCRIQDGQDL